MKKIFGLLAGMALMISACNSGKNAETNNADSTQIAQTEASNVISVDDFDSIAKDNIDKEIQVKGIIDHVCRHSGKRLFMVGDKGQLHIDGEERFSDSLAGANLIVTGIVREFRIDEAYCLQQEQDNIKSHSKSKTNKELFEQKKKQIAEYRDSMKAAKVDHLSFYSLEYKSHKAE